MARKRVRDLINEMEELDTLPIEDEEEEIDALEEPRRFRRWRRRRRKADIDIDVTGGEVEIETDEGDFDEEPEGSEELEELKRRLRRLRRRRRGGLRRFGKQDDIDVEEDFLEEDFDEVDVGDEEEEYIGESKVRAARRRLRRLTERLERMRIDEESSLERLRRRAKARLYEMEDAAEVPVDIEPMETVIGDEEDELEELKRRIRRNTKRLRRRRRKMGVMEPDLDTELVLPDEEEEESDVIEEPEEELRRFRRMRQLRRLRRMRESLEHLNEEDDDLESMRRRVRRLRRKAQRLSDVDVEEGKMHRLLGVPPDKKISDVFSSPEAAVRKLVQATGSEKEAASMINWAANISNDPFLKAMQRAIKEIDFKEGVERNDIKRSPILERVIELIHYGSNTKK